ncbi:MAG TPA: nuclear transport factor 2 family protein [Pyrinomonadaceae bacterium]|jgi:ketosteroid isomerase-like protein|nr:nuclear transport factor 2 family protein [Pyrinomonadaceae bacterium]
MDEKGQNTSVNRSERTSPTDPEKTVATPHFDAAAIEQARPAVPLSRLKPERSSSSWPPSLLLAIAIVAGLAGGIIGGILPMIYLKNDAAKRAASSPAPAETTRAAADPATGPGGTSASGQTPSQDDRQREDGTLPAASDEAERGENGAEEGEVAAPKELEATLRGALEDWVAATNSRDIDRQMSFYNPVVNAFYRRRNASRADVRADKARVFERASSIDIRAGAPDIRLSPDGRTAIMRFRKQYAIAGGGEDRRGEVLQELRWQRTGGQWRIVSERDLRVVR